MSNKIPSQSAQLTKSSKVQSPSSAGIEIKNKFKGFFRRDHPENADFQQNTIGKRGKLPTIFVSKRRKIQKINLEPRISNDKNEQSDQSSSDPSTPDDDPRNFTQYIEKLEDSLIFLRNFQPNDYESTAVLKVLQFLENLIHQPKEWVSGAKSKLSEMKFPETALIYMRHYKENGDFIRRTVFVHSILLYNAMSNFTDHEFDKEGSIRTLSAEAGFIEFSCEVLRTFLSKELLKRSQIIDYPEQIQNNENFQDYQKTLYICDSALTILYNMANLPDLKIQFRDCGAIHTFSEFTKLSVNSLQINFHRTNENKEVFTSLKELQDIINAIRITSCLLLPLILNEDEDNTFATNISGIFPILSEMIKTYNQKDQRFYGFSFTELLDGLSKLMVRGRTHHYVDKNLIDLLLNILTNPSHDISTTESVTSAILNASFDEKIQEFLNCDQVVQTIQSTRDRSSSQLVKKNCEAVLWTINRIPHRTVSTINENSQSQGHIMISYNRSVSAMCLKIRDRLKALHYAVWLDVDNINGGVLESMAKAVENSSIVLICMNEQYKQSYYCRLEAEYATELRKPCIPCLMQPRFRPYGWLGIIKGAKIHVDFAQLPFDEAFSLLIREVETIQKENPNKINQTTTDGITSHSNIHVVNNEQKVEIHQNNEKTNLIEEKIEHDRLIEDWGDSDIRNWLESRKLTNLAPVLADMDGNMLVRLHQMKKQSHDSYYQFLCTYFTNQPTLRMSDALKFDRELDNLLEDFSKKVKF